MTPNAASQQSNCSSNASSPDYGNCCCMTEQCCESEPVHDQCQCEPSEGATSSCNNCSDGCCFSSSDPDRESNIRRHLIERKLESVQHRLNDLKCKYSRNDRRQNAKSCSTSCSMSSARSCSSNKTPSVTSRRTSCYNTPSSCSGYCSTQKCRRSTRTHHANCCNSNSNCSVEKPRSSATPNCVTIPEECTKASSGSAGRCKCKSVPKGYTWTSTGSSGRCQCWANPYSTWASSNCAQGCQCCCAYPYQCAWPSSGPSGTCQCTTYPLQIDCNWARTPSSGPYNLSSKTSTGTQTERVNDWVNNLYCNGCKKLKSMSGCAQCNKKSLTSTGSQTDRVTSGPVKQLNSDNCNNKSPLSKVKRKPQKENLLNKLL